MNRLTSWIKAHSHLHNREYNQAVSTFRQLDDRSSLRDNLNLLVAMGESYYYSGDHKNALIVLQRVSTDVSYKQALSLRTFDLSLEAIEFTCIRIFYTHTEMSVK